MKSLYTTPYWASRSEPT